MPLTITTAVPSLIRAAVVMAIACFAFDVEAGWHHRYAAGCGSCGSHRHHRSHGSSGGSHGSSGGSHGSAGGAAAAAPAPAPAATPDKKAAIEAPEAKPLLVGATTRLTLRVPADAKVWIEGQLTDSTGELREFGTKALADGQAWENYEVRVGRGRPRCGDDPPADAEGRFRPRRGHRPQGRLPGDSGHGVGRVAEATSPVASPGRLGQ